MYRSSPYKFSFREYRDKSSCTNSFSHIWLCFYIAIQICIYEKSLHARHNLSPSPMANKYLDTSVDDHQYYIYFDILIHLSHIRYLNHFYDLLKKIQRSYEVESIKSTLNKRSYIDPGCIDYGFKKPFCCLEKCHTKIDNCREV
jgi:hypothetical protein